MTDRAKTLCFDVNTNLTTFLDFTINYFEGKAREFTYSNNPAFSTPHKGSILITSPKLQDTKIILRGSYYTGSEWIRDEPIWIVANKIDDSKEIYVSCIYQNCLWFDDLLGRYRIAVIKNFSKINSYRIITEDLSQDINEYDVALSFSKEQRDYVSKVNSCLIDKGFSTFYDEDHEIELWGEDLPDIFIEIYSKKSKIVVIFISKEYMQSKWTNIERKAAISKAIELEEVYILPVKFDETELSGLPKTVSYLNAKENPPEVLCQKIIEKLGSNKTS